MIGLIHMITVLVLKCVHLMLEGNSHTCILFIETLQGYSDEKRKRNSGLDGVPASVIYFVSNSNSFTQSLACGPVVQR